ncbi:hypothetical protein [Taklimakanibacter albus]|uniref:Uncharacterized protein n=1 Tax=Taklimakanibacter albus TaxID=2800327 RepID=A0ACC5RDA8_9HYPH|nr:hypothetical protein [Aestuariivirga sp. YIM B02566]MBK1870456.1 hypothetical protein [Aestuariivirga sp. YIM B02566]
MHIFLMLGLIVVCLAAAWLYVELRPGLRKIRDSLNALTAYGADQAEIRFIHRRSGREIVFRKEIVGGVQQILLVTQRLKLSASEEVKVREFLESRGLKVETRKKSKRAKSTNVVVLGHSAEKAAGITTELAKEVLSMSSFTRFRFEFEGMNFPSRR